jgi:hypothetical protein
MAESIVMPTNPRFKNLTGCRFGKLVVVAYSKPRHRTSLWECRCDCGENTIAQGCNLVTGNSTNCGCVRQDRLTTHGCSKSAEYNIWRGIRSRCYNQNEPAYRYYGGRGITVCERWRESFENFLADMSERPTPRHTIDRIDNDGDYDPSNCQWATRKQQQRNRRVNRLLTWQGETKCVAEWADCLGWPAGLIRGRLNRGWSVEKTLGTTYRPYSTRK